MFRGKVFLQHNWIFENFSEIDFDEGEIMCPRIDSTEKLHDNLNKY